MVISKGISAKSPENSGLGTILICLEYIEVWFETVDGRNPAGTPSWGKGSLSHQSSALYIPGGAGFLPSTVSIILGDYLSSNKPTTVQTLIWDTQNSPKDDQELPRNPEQNVKNPGNAKVVSLTKHTINVVFN